MGKYFIVTLHNLSPDNSYLPSHMSERVASQLSWHVYIQEELSSHVSVINYEDKAEQCTHSLAVEWLGVLCILLAGTPSLDSIKVTVCTSSAMLAIFCAPLVSHQALSRRVEN